MSLPQRAETDLQPLPLYSEEAQMVIDFVQHEACLLDDGRYEDWIELFPEDGLYWVPIDRTQKDPKTYVSLFNDSKEFLRTRVERLRHPQIHVQIPNSRTSRMMSHYYVSKAPCGDVYHVRAKYMMFEYRPGHPQQTYAGDCEYYLSRLPNGFSINLKKVLLINSDGVFPALAVPF